jgi:flagellar basal-body rod protein FlgB
MLMDVSNQDSLLRLMSASSLRAKVLAHNVANQNTPGFRRQEVQFEEQLLKLIQRGRSDISRIQPMIVEDLESPSRPDGNNVSLEQELTASRENRVMFEVWAAILQGRMSILNSAVNGAR